VNRKNPEIIEQSYYFLFLCVRKRFAKVLTAVLALLKLLGLKVVNLQQTLFPGLDGLNHSLDGRLPLREIVNLFGSQLAGNFRFEGLNSIVKFVPEK